MQRAWVRAGRYMLQWGGRCESTLESLTDCSPATHHQMVVETKAGGSPFAASRAQPQKAEGHPGHLMESTTGREQG